MSTPNPAPDGGVIINDPPDQPMTIEIHGNDRCLARILVTVDGKLDAEYDPDDLTDSALRFVYAMRQLSQIHGVR